MPKQSNPATAATPAARKTAVARKAGAAKAAVKAAGRPKADEVEARVDELMCIAGQLFLAKGYGKVSLEMIAKEARVAVRTIYVKFGGKTGLLSAVLLNKRETFFANMDMDLDPRPLKEVLNDFASRLFNMITSPEALALQRILAAEAGSNSDLVQTFFVNGPDQTRAAIARFLGRPDIRAQLRDDLPVAQLPVFLINCILGDQMARTLLNRQEHTPEDRAQALAERLELFYRAVLR